MTAGALSVDCSRVDEAALLTVAGTLDATTYRPLRNAIIKAALDDPAAVLVDIADLQVPATSALTVFTSASWHVGRWPEVPIALLCPCAIMRSSLTRIGVSRYLPVHTTLADAVAGCADRPRRRRARTELPGGHVSPRYARQLVTETLTAWSCSDLIPVTKVIVTALVENVLQHTDSRPVLRLENAGDTVTVAVRDGSRRQPCLREEPTGVVHPSGLDIVSTLARSWGSAPTPTGKTVWALVGPENRL